MNSEIMPAFFFFFFYTSSQESAHLNENQRKKLLHSVGHPRTEVGKSEKSIAECDKPEGT